VVTDTILTANQLPDPWRARSTYRNVIITQCNYSIDLKLCSIIYQYHIMNTYAYKRQRYMTDNTSYRWTIMHICIQVVTLNPRRRIVSRGWRELSGQLHFRVSPGNCSNRVLDERDV
jgi:hypothetical protein